MSDAEIRDYFIEKSDLLVAQGWVYALAAPLILVSALAVRRSLHKTSETAVSVNSFGPV